VNPKSFFGELKRRNVYKVAVAYAVVSWLLIQAASILLPTFEAPTWVMKSFVVLLALGLVLAVIISWAFELTPDGIKHTEDVDPPDRRVSKNRTWIYVTVVGAAFSVGLFLVGRYTARNSSSAFPAGAPEKSIAVLPFVNMSADRNDEYLSDGMTEELINVLSKVPGLRVPGRTSCFAFKGKNEEDIFRKVGDQLHVGTILEGSVGKAGEKLRVTAQLINVSDGYHLWSKDYDGDVKDILNFQSNVAEQVVQALQVKLGGDQTRAFAKKPTENPEAYRLYLLGRYYFAKFTQEGWSKAIDYYNKALRVDPNYALAYCGLADTYSSMGGLTMQGKEAWAREKELAQKALAFDPNLADAHLSLGLALAASFDWKEGEKEIKRAVEINPNLAMAYDQYAWVLTVFGRFDEALAKERKALELDPLSPLMNGNLGVWLYGARRYDEATAQLRRTFEFDPNSALAHFFLGWCSLGKGNAADATAEFEKAKTLDDLPMYEGALGYAYAISGDRAKAEQVLDRLEDASKQRYVSAGSRAYVYLGLGDKEKIYEWLEKGYEERDWICFWLNVDPIFDRLRNEARFRALVKKVGLDQ
jgi:TolB-like protein/Flp pilus assembly protein TadD